jgi:macrolide transport system ATP-binding/permease protein
VLVISHDRYFLERVVERIVELEDGRLAEFPGSYTYYRDEKARRAQVGGQALPIR